MTTDDKNISKTVRHSDDGPAIGDESLANPLTTAMTKNLKVTLDSDIFNERPKIRYNMTSPQI